MLHKLLIASTYLLCLSFIIVQGQDTNVKFGDNIVIITLKNQVLRHPTISDDGNFVFANLDSLKFDADGTTILESKVLDINQALWDISATTNNNVTFSTPIKDIKLNDPFRAAGAFSYDSKYLGVKTNDELKVFTLPDLKLSSSIPAISSLEKNDFYRYIAWSTNEHVLAGLTDDGIVTWDLDQKEIKSFPLKYNFSFLHPIENGWFIESLDYSYLHKEKLDDLFTFCTTHLEHCDAYKDEKHHEAIMSDDGRIFLSHYGDVLTNGTLGIWERNEQEKYKLSSEHLIDAPPTNQHGQGFCPQNLSPDGIYIVSTCFQMPTQIWKTDPFEFKQATQNSIIIWLPDSTHFISWEYFPNFVLRLYEVGNEIPLDVLDLAKQTGLEDISKWVNGFPTGDERIDVAQNGNRILINLGLAALVIPIEYQ
ncbi:MAG: hypothetical protein GC179_29465 [Anaerolineaceae bacterium]|nr:hypothetical protein [Anaerolineaceae bacterium]